MTTKGHHRVGGDKNDDYPNPPTPTAVKSVASSDLETIIPFLFGGNEAVMTGVG